MGDYRVPPASGSGARPLVRGLAQLSAAGDQRCILIGLSVWVWLDQVDVVYFPVCKCMNDPNGVCIVLLGCLDRMIGGNIIAEEIPDHGSGGRRGCDLLAI